MTQAIGEERAELATQFAQRLVADEDAALVRELLNVTLTEEEAMVEL